MRRHVLLGMSLAATLLACGDDSSITDPDPLVPPVALLKNIEIPNLPSPYYHFEYDVANQVSVVSFASGGRVYAVRWDGDRIVRMVNTVGSRDTHTYTYDGSGRVGTSPSRTPAWNWRRSRRLASRMCDHTPLTRHP